MLLDIILFELLLIWSYFFIVMKNSFSNTLNLFLKLFISNISIITFITTIVMGLIKFDLIFVIMSVLIIMILINFIYEYVGKKYAFYSNRYYFVNKIKPLLDCLLITFISLNIYY